MSDGASTAALPGFDADTAVAPLGEGRFAAAMSERWWVGKGPNGGYVAAVILKAIQAAAGGGRPPRSLTVHFLRAPAAGPVEVAVTVEREGGRATFLSARLSQDGTACATALAVLSDGWSGDGFSEVEMPDAGAPGELQTLDPSVEGRPNMLQNYRLRPALGEPAFSGGPARNGAGSAPASRACWTRRWPRPCSTPGSPPPTSASTARARRRLSTTPSTSARRCRRPAPARRTPT